MDISQSSLALLYLYALIMGGALGALYDAFRITRVFLGVHYSRRAARRLQELRLPFLKPYKRRRESRALGVVIFFEDLIFCLLAGILLILLLYEANNGKFRFPVILCAGAGFLLYRGTLGRLVMLFSEVIAFLIETAVRYLLFFLLFPLRVAILWGKKQVKKMTDRAVQIQNKSMRRRYTVAQSSRALRDACGLVPKDAPKETRLKRGKRFVKGRENTIQSYAANALTSRRVGRGSNRSVCK